MTISNAERSYREAWTRLLDLVVFRNELLRRLDMIWWPAMELAPAGGVEFESDSAPPHDLLAAVDELTPRIAAAIDEVNRHAEQTGCPQVRWQDLCSNFRV